MVSNFSDRSDFLETGIVSWFRQLTNANAEIDNHFRCAHTPGAAQIIIVSILSTLLEGERHLPSAL